MQHSLDKVNAVDLNYLIAAIQTLVVCLQLTCFIQSLRASMDVLACLQLMWFMGVPACLPLQVLMLLSFICQFAVIVFVV